MAQKTITQRIAFEGGPEMELQLRNLGEAGATAFQRLQTAADNASGFGARLTAAVDAVKAKLDSLAVSGAKVQQAFSDLGSKVESSAKSFLYSSVAVGGTVAAFALWIDKAAQAARASEELAGILNISTQELEDLQGAAAQFGIAGDEFVKGLSRIGKQIETTAKQHIAYGLQVKKLSDEYLAGKISADAYLQGQQNLNNTAVVQTNIFERLGIATQGAGGQARNTLAIMYDLADAFQNATDKDSKFAIAQEFSRAGMSKFIPFLNQGSAAIKQMAAETERVAPAFTELQKQVGISFSGAFNTLKLSATKAQESLALVFAPEFTDLAKALTEAIANNRDQLISLGSYIAQQLRPIIDDIITLLQGGTLNKDSIVEQTRVAIVAFAKDAYGAIQLVIGAWNVMVSALDGVANIINSVFGTQLTGRMLAIFAIVGTITGAFGILFSAIGAGVSVVGFLVAAFGGANVAVAALGVVLGVALEQFFVNLPAIATATWKALVDGFNGTVDNFRTLFNLIGIAWELLWKTMGDAAKNVINDVLDWLGGLWDKIKSAADALTGLGGGSSNSNTAAGFAGGGAISGPGGPRSDSIWARVSNGEFIHNAAAVQHYGTDFMHAINNLKFPKLGFSTGGLVEAMSGFIPRFADGGLASFAASSATSSGHPVTLNIGGEVFKGLTAEDATFERLQRFAVRKNITSMGRKPLWVG